MGGFGAKGRLVRGGTPVSGCIEAFVNDKKVRMIDRLSGSGKLLDGVLVNASPPPFGTNGYYDIWVPISEYEDVLKCGTNEIKIRATVPDPPAPKCGVGGQVVELTKYAYCECNCTYSLSCSIDKTEVRSGQSVKISGTLTSDDKRNCPVANQAVEIYLNGAKVVSAQTDSQGRFSADIKLTCHANIYHTIEARFGSQSCSKHVRCVAPPQQARQTLVTMYYDSRSILSDVLKLTVDGTEIDISELAPDRSRVLQKIQQSLENWSMDEELKDDLRRYLMSNLTDYSTSDVSKILAVGEQLWLELGCITVASASRAWICKNSGNCCCSTAKDCASKYGWSWLSNAFEEVLGIIKVSKSTSVTL